MITLFYSTDVDNRNRAENGAENYGCSATQGDRRKFRGFKKQLFRSRKFPFAGHLPRPVQYEVEEIVYENTSPVQKPTTAHQPAPHKIQEQRPQPIPQQQPILQQQPQRQDLQQLPERVGFGLGLEVDPEVRRRRRRACRSPPWPPRPAYCGGCGAEQGRDPGVRDRGGVRGGGGRRRPADRRHHRVHCAPPLSSAHQARRRLVLHSSAYSRHRRRISLPHFAPFFSPRLPCPFSPLPRTPRSFLLAHSRSLPHSLHSFSPPPRSALLLLPLSVSSPTRSARPRPPCVTHPHTQVPRTRPLRVPRPVRVPHPRLPAHIHSHVPMQHRPRPPAPYFPPSEAALRRPGRRRPAGSLRVDVTAVSIAVTCPPPFSSPCVAATACSPPCGCPPP